MHEVPSELYIVFVLHSHANNSVKIAPTGHWQIPFPSSVVCEGQIQAPSTICFVGSLQ